MTVSDAVNEALLFTFSANFLLFWVWDLATTLCQEGSGTWVEALAPMHGDLGAEPGGYNPVQLVPGDMHCRPVPLGAAGSPEQTHLGQGWQCQAMGSSFLLCLAPPLPPDRRAVMGQINGQSPPWLLAPTVASSRCISRRAHGQGLSRVTHTWQTFHDAERLSA